MHVVRKYTNWFLSILHVEMGPFRLNLQSCHYGNCQCEDKNVIQLSYPCDVVMDKSTAPNAARTTNQKDWLTSTKQNTQRSFDNRLEAPKSYGAITFLFDLIPKYKAASMIKTITLQQTRRSTETSVITNSHKITKIPHHFGQASSSLKIFCPQVSFDEKFIFASLLATGYVGLLITLWESGWTDFRARNVQDRLKMIQGTFFSDIS